MRYRQRCDINFTVSTTSTTPPWWPRGRRRERGEGRGGGGRGGLTSYDSLFTWFDSGHMLMRQSCSFLVFLVFYVKVASILRSTLSCSFCRCACWFCWFYAPRTVSLDLLGDVFKKMLPYSTLAQWIHAQASVYRAFTESHTFSTCMCTRDFLILSAGPPAGTHRLVLRVTIHFTLCPLLSSTGP